MSKIISHKIIQVDMPICEKERYSEFCLDNDISGWLIEKEIKKSKVYYWYGIGGYEGNGCLMLIDLNLKEILFYDLSHCSCYGPLNQRKASKKTKDLKNPFADISKEAIEREWKTIMKAYKKDFIKEYKDSR